MNTANNPYQRVFLCRKAVSETDRSIIKIKGNPDVVLYKGDQAVLHSEGKSAKSDGKSGKGKGKGDVQQMKARTRRNVL